MWLTDKASEVTSERLTSLYAYPPGGAYVRANMVASIDGAAGLEGRSGGLGGPGDRKIFSLLRACADVVVVGASTAVTEGYHQPDGPALALVSRFHCRSRRLWAAVAPADCRPHMRLRTGAASCGPRPRRRDPARLRHRHRRSGGGHRRVRRAWLDAHPPRGRTAPVGSFVAADALDELCLTTSPVIVGGSAPRPVVVDAEKVHPMTRAHLLSDDDGYLYARWIRGTDQAPGDA